MAQKERSFREELTGLLNRYSMENGSDTPDYLLANYVIGCLQVWNTVVPQRDSWHRQQQPNLSSVGGTV